MEKYVVEVHIDKEAYNNKSSRLKVNQPLYVKEYHWFARVTNDVFKACQHNTIEGAKRLMRSVLTAKGNIYPITSARILKVRFEPEILGVIDADFVKRLPKV